MRILLLSISPNKSGNRQRTDYLAEALRMNGHEAIIVRWNAWNDPVESSILANEIVIRLMPSGSRYLGKNQVPVWNQWMVWRNVRSIVNKRHIDLVVWPNNWFAIGYPPRSFPVPIAIDYFDLLEKGMEERYFVDDRIVLCASMELQTQSQRWTKNAWWIPTPIELSRFAYPRAEAKRLIGVPEDTVVLSLIGLTASPKLYFIDAIDHLEINNVVCLLVGDGELLEPIRRKLPTMRHPERVRILGKVPYEKVSAYFCATDVGLYPGEDIDYFHSACPIKILEYSASGAAVVANDLRELRRWDFPNIFLTDPSPDGFRKGIEHATRANGLQPNLDSFSLESVSHRLEGVLQLTGKNVTKTVVTEA
jgi:glycosyltransferase involved in cell wall biosynthesis